LFPIGPEDSDIWLHADWLLDEVIVPVFRDHLEFKVERADKIRQPGLIDAQIIDLILTADLANADLSFLNSNAFYEIGIRHMAQKPVIHMHRAGEKIPFDISLYRSMEFARTRPSDLRALLERS